MPGRVSWLLGSISLVPGSNSLERFLGAVRVSLVLGKVCLVPAPVYWVRVTISFVPVSISWVGVMMTDKKKILLHSFK